MNPYTIYRFKRTNGERTVTLIDRSTGIPLYYPCLYKTAILERRTPPLAANSVESHMRAVMLFEISLLLQNIDLNERLCHGQILTSGEIDQIIAACGKKMAALTEVKESNAFNHPKHPRMTNMESYLMRVDSNNDEDLYSQAYTRIMYIREYLDWRASHIEQITSTPDHVKLLLAAARATIEKAIRIRCTHRPKPGSRERARSLTDEQWIAIRCIIDPADPANPFKNPFVRFRNALLLQLFYSNTLRMGDLLTLKACDIKFNTNTAQFVRRPDDPEDYRARRAELKTRGRELPLSTNVIEGIHFYLTDTEMRPKYIGKKKHSFVFISDDGNPLSMAGVHAIFRRIRETVPGLPHNFSSHYGKHTVNEWMRRDMTGRAMNPDLMKNVARATNGWSPTSEMDEIYTRPYIMEQARAVSLNVQKRLLIKKEDQ
jgi:integrase